MEKENPMLTNLGIKIHPNEANYAPEQFSNCYFDPNWDNSMDQSDPFESALSSMVSSPATTTTNAATAGDVVVLREVIGRLGSICGSDNNKFSPQSYNINNLNNYNNSTNSCHTTPLSSPKLSWIGCNLNYQISSDPGLAAFSADSGFAESAARYSNLGVGNCDSQHPNRIPHRMDNLKFAKFLSRCSSPDNGGGGEGSSVLEQIPNKDVVGMRVQSVENGRKRKSVSKGKEKETTLPSPAKTDPKVKRDSDESNGKRRKPNEASGNDVDIGKSKREENEKGKIGGNDGNNRSGPKPTTAPAEPPKDYIHVRARRGQATDSHSLAERVRREKISGRMKFLQDLVPGCNKMIGKAVMLDEIINYVQSLQRQVEFLSMKLATVNPKMDFTMEALLSKDILQSRGSIPHNIYPLDTTFPFGYQTPQGPFSIPPLNSSVQRNTSIQLPPIDCFTEAASQALEFWEDDLQSVVQMGFGQNQQQDIRAGTGQMKAELL